MSCLKSRWTCFAAGGILVIFVCLELAFRWTSGRVDSQQWLTNDITQPVHYRRLGFRDWFGFTSSSTTTSNSSSSSSVMKGSSTNSISTTTAPADDNLVGQILDSRATNSSLQTTYLLSNKLSREQCFQKYGERQYYQPSERRLPPMLYTFPGSGNTWARLLIEHSTNILTGSVYNDAKLLKALPGEFKCNYEVSVVKVHPHTHPFEGLRTGKFNSDAEKCKKGKIKGFQKAILLIRDPFDSIWSEYQRRVTQSHVIGLKKSEFDW